MVKTTTMKDFATLANMIVTNSCNIAIYTLILLFLPLVLLLISLILPVLKDFATCANSINIKTTNIDTYT
jgi:hypothetical protein